jgi:putative membrane protein
MATLVDKYFSEADLNQITEAVKAAELKTSGEIVVRLTPHSKHWLVDRWIFASLLGIVFAVVSLFVTAQSNWGTYYNYSQAVLWGIVGFLIGFWGIYAFLRRPSARHSAVWKNALRHFAGLRPTRGHTGVLIFMSMEEEDAAVVADKAIAGKLDPGYWQHPHSLIEKAMKEDRHAEGIIQAIGEIADQMSQYFPREADDINELPDRPEIVS